jgi:hypothetical protein
MRRAIGAALVVPLLGFRGGETHPFDEAFRAVLLVEDISQRRFRLCGRLET